MGNLLVIDDDPDLAVLLRIALTSDGHRVTIAHTAADVVNHVTRPGCDLLMIDLGLPDGDGKEAVRRVRAASGLPIIVVTGRGELSERVEALDAGADDYVLKPFLSEELLARVRAQLRRATPTPLTDPLRFDRVVIDPAARQVWLDGELVRFTPTELQMLLLLAQNANRLVTHTQLYRQVWPDGSGESGHYVRVYIQQIRQKLGDSASAPTFIATELAHGYRWLPGLLIDQDQS